MRTSFAALRMSSRAVLLPAILSACSGCMASQDVAVDALVPPAALVRVTFVPPRTLPLRAGGGPLVGLEWIDGHVVRDGADSLWLRPQRAQAGRDRVARRDLAAVVAVPHEGTRVAIRSFDREGTLVTMLTISCVLLATLFAYGLAHQG